MLTNLRFILEHEPNFTDVTKLFILNRLTDANEQKEAQRLIAEYGHEVLVLPFVADEYAALGWNLEPFGSLDFFTSPEFYSHGFQSQMRKKILACRPKINYAMNVNGARNAAIKAGRKVAEWTVVLDGSCIFSAASFKRFYADSKTLPFTPYKIIPMHRLEENEDYKNSSREPESSEEPQIAFHCLARYQFDERFPYGFRDKTSLLNSLGVLGPWRRWENPPWAPIESNKMTDKYRYRYTSGVVLRLSSGAKRLDGQKSHRERYSARNTAILTTIAQLNKIYGTLDDHVTDIVTSTLDKS